MSLQSVTTANPTTSSNTANLKEATNQMQIEPTPTNWSGFNEDLGIK